VFDLRGVGVKRVKCMTVLVYFSFSSVKVDDTGMYRTDYL